MNVQGSIMKKAKIIQSDNLQNCFVFLFTFRHLYFKIRKYIVYLQKKLREPVFQGTFKIKTEPNLIRVIISKSNFT